MDMGAGGPPLFQTEAATPTPPTYQILKPPLQPVIQHWHGQIRRQMKTAAPALLVVRHIKLFVHLLSVVDLPLRMTELIVLYMVEYSCTGLKESVI